MFDLSFCLLSMITKRWMALSSYDDDHDARLC